MERGERCGALTRHLSVRFSPSPSSMERGQGGEAVPACLYQQASAIVRLQTPSRRVAIEDDVAVAMNRRTRGAPVLTFNHVALFVSNLDESTRFYTELLGCTVITSYPMPNGGKITYLRCDGGQIELISTPGVTRPAEPPELGPGPGIRHIAFKTDDLETIAARLQVAGVKF